MEKRTRIYLYEKAVAELQETIENKVRRCIIGAGGLVGMQPTSEDMPDTDDLKLNYHFSSRHYNNLFLRLDRLVRTEKAGAYLLTTEVKNCGKVSDCVKLVKEKIA